MSRGPSSRSLIAACGVAAAVALTPAAASAGIASGYEDFAGCPQRADVTACEAITIKGGEIGLGNLKVPISQALPFAGGASNTDLGSFFVSDDGTLLNPATQSVPGGASGLTGDASVGSDEVSVVAEAVGDGEFTENGVTVPLRFVLSGAGLPEGCAIGSASEPVKVALTSATTTPPEGVAPITGDAGDGGIDVIRTVAKVDNATLVDNGYAVPGASGCGTSVGGQEVGSVDALINGAQGLPAAPGASVFTGSGTSIRIALDTSKVFTS